MKRHPLPMAIAAALVFALPNSIPAEGPGSPLARVNSEFIYEKAPFPSCHASTIAEVDSGLVAAWFGGTAEKHPDVGIWFAERRSDRWLVPREVATGVQPTGKRFPCWNPVLFKVSRGPLLLFYKVGPSPSEWWGMLMRSTDNGATWSSPEKLPEGFLGPIKNKPVIGPDGRLWCGSSTEHAGWRVHLEFLDLERNAWDKTDALNKAADFGAIQPSILRFANGRILLLCRSRQGRIVGVWSEDEGKRWQPMFKTVLPNPNSGTDAVMLKDGRALLVYNHTRSGRSPLNVAISSDGERWQAAVILESASGEFSYPAVIQSRDGLVHVTYTWKRQRIKHAVIDPLNIALQEMPEGRWP